MKKFLKKHRKLIIGLCVTAVVIVGGWIWLKNASRKALDRLQTATIETAKVERRNLVSVVSATGKVTSNDSKSLAPAVSGVKISELNVSVGDYVKAGDVLLVLDSSKIEDNLEIANKNLETSQKSADLSINSAKRRVNEAQTSSKASEQKIADQISQTESNLNKLKDLRDQALNLYKNALASRQTIEAKYNPVAQAYNNKYALETTISASDAAIASANQVITAETANIAAADSQITTANGNIATAEAALAIDPNDAAAAQLKSDNEAIKATAEAAKTAAQAKKTAAEAAKTEAETKKAEAQAALPGATTAFETAEATYGSLTSLSTALEAAKSAESAQLANYNSYATQYDSSESSLESLRKSGEDTARANASTIASTKDSLKSAELSAANGSEQVKQQIAAYEEQLDACTVTAPFDGVITAVNYEVGDTYAGVALMTIEDVSRYVVTTEIDEYDIGKIKKGQSVVIKTNGTGEEKLDGTVISVAPKATQSMSGGVTYTVKVSIDTKNDMLRLDMTAKLSIILDSAEGVLTVPYDSVLTDDEGLTYVEVVDGRDEKNGLITHRVDVKVGTSSDYYVEVESAELTEGTEVNVIREDSSVFDFSRFFSRSGPMGGM
ncbi:MAG: HlyD family efflux transporter periplasmic adaptor subunit [Lachnospiraceae bacterium]|nr:HlyD family efflux transporter periplasmic adaptor subunit [Lachnospiraceae bacterium]